MHSIPNALADVTKSEKSNYDVTVVLNIHREAQYLKPTLLSLSECVAYSVKQGISVQLVAVLDRSDKETEDIYLGTNLSAFNSIKTVKTDFGSLGLARNAGITVSDGEFIWTADGDDLVSENCLHKLITTARAHPNEKVAVFCQYLIHFGEEYCIARFEPSSLICAADFAVCHPYVSKIFLRRRWFDDFSYRDLKLTRGFAYEDWHLNARLMAGGFHLEIAANCAIFYRKRSNSLLHLADRQSARIIPHCELFEQETFLREMARKRSETADWNRFLIIRQNGYEIDFVNEVLGSSEMRQYIVSAARLDPEVDPSRIQSASSFCPIPWNRNHWGFSLEAALELVGNHKFTDVVLLPYLMPGGAEKFILEVVDLLCRLEADRKVLFISGQKAQTVGWRDRLNSTSVFLDIYNAFPRLEDESRDALTARLILSVACDGARIHVKPSEFAYRLIDRFGVAFASCYQVIYYRFGDDVLFWNGSNLRRDWTIRFLRRNAECLHSIITDCMNAIKGDLEVLPQLSAKYHCIRSLCRAEEHLPRTASQPRFRLLWASRISKEKRPELIAPIAAALLRKAPHVSIDIYGSLGDGYSAKQLTKWGNVTYKGAFDGFESLPIEQYDALIYTSSFDGLPNVVLEAMAEGLSVVAPEVGGIAEAVFADTGFLIPNHPEESVLVMAYINAVSGMYADWPATTMKRSAARKLVIEQHGWDNFDRCVKRAFRLHARVTSETAAYLPAAESAFQHANSLNPKALAQLKIKDDFPNMSSNTTQHRVIIDDCRDNPRGTANMIEEQHGAMTAEQRIAYLEALVKARDRRITELGNLLHNAKSASPSRLKSLLIYVWKNLPRSVQRTIEPFADFIDRKIK